MFRNAQVGDKVISPSYGIGKIWCINDDVYAIEVVFDYNALDLRTYTVEGKYAKTDTEPTLFYLEGYVPASCKEPVRLPKFEHDEAILVRRDTEQEWCRRHFKEFKGEEAVCYVEGNSSLTNAGGYLGFWKYFKKLERR